MAQISENPSGGKRSLNADLNLVPFIDLLSVCICFLLISAVWLQVGTVQVKQAYGTNAPVSKQETLEVLVTFVDAYKVNFAIRSQGKNLSQALITGTGKDDFSKNLTAEVESKFAMLKAGKDVSIADIISAATIVPVKAANYANLVTVMDVLRKHEVVNLAVMPKAG